MVSSQPLLLIVAGDRREFAAPHGSAVEIGIRWARSSTLGGRRALLAANGAGRDNAAEAVRTAAKHFPISAVVSTGWVGALDPRFQVGEIFVADAVVLTPGRLEYPVNLPQVPPSLRFARGCLATCDHVVVDRLERDRLRALGARAVDMEAAGAAAAAADLELPFFAVRAVSDTATTDLPVDFNRARRADGTFSGWRTAALAGWSARSWRALLALKRNAETASAALADFLNQCRFPTSPTK